MAVLPYSLTLTVAPSGEPLSLSEAKDHCQVPFADDDSMILAMIRAARYAAEREANTYFLTQTFELGLDDWWGECLKLPNPPWQSVDEIRYQDENDTTQTVDSADYVFHKRRGVLEWKAGTVRPELTGDYQAERITVKFVSGFGDAAADVPESVRNALLLEVGHLYKERESVLIGSISKPIELAYKHLLNAAVQEYKA